MADNLKIMMERSAAIPENRRAINVKEIADFEWHAGNVYVQNWVDGSSHYGFSYRLSDGTLGFLFNDGTTLTTKDQRYDRSLCSTKMFINSILGNTCSSIVMRAMFASTKLTITTSPLNSRKNVPCWESL